MFGSKMTFAALVAASLSTTALAQQSGPRVYSTTQPDTPRYTAIMSADQAYPAAEVSRELAEQRVHPHLAKLVIGGGPAAVDEAGATAKQTTYIDPTRRLDGARGLDESHSIVRARAHYLARHGDRYELPNRARLIVAPARADDAADNAKPMFIFRKPNGPVPTQRGELIARTD